MTLSDKPNTLATQWTQWERASLWSVSNTDKLADTHIDPAALQPCTSLLKPLSSMARERERKFLMFIIYKTVLCWRRLCNNVPLLSKLCACSNFLATDVFWLEGLWSLEKVPKTQPCNAHKHIQYACTYCGARVSSAGFSCALSSPSLSDDIIPWQCHHSYRCCLQNLELDSYCVCCSSSQKEV